MTRLPPPSRAAFRAFAAALALLLAGFGCQGPRAVAEAPAPLRVLFIGNSHLYVNGLPGMVAELARSAGGRALAVEVVAFPDHGLEDHWARPEARRALARGGWDVVVLQQGPSSLAESRAELIRAGLRWNEEIRRGGGRTAFLGVWPSRSRRADAARAAESYRLAAEACGASLCAAGEAWSLALEEDPGTPLYAADGLHAAPAGTYLAALLVHARLHGGLPAGEALYVPRGVPRPLALRLREIAAKVSAVRGSRE